MTPRAILRGGVPQDLNAIVDYFAERDPAVAARFIDAVQETIATVVQHPGRGSPKTYRGRKYAALRTQSVTGFPSYLVIYRPVDVGVLIVAVCHGARDIQRLLRDRL